MKNIPRVGCGAAILNDKGQLLLVQRLKAPEAGHWGLPGGKLDYLEQLEDCISREIEEELGITITIDRLLCLTDQHHKADDQHWVAPVYLVREFSGEPVNREPEKHGGIGWFDLDDLPEKLTLPTLDAVEALSAKSG